MSGLDEENFMTAQPKSSSRRRAQPAKGVSLGLEDEVDVGSDEDLMENIGEIEVASSGGWYPGKPDSPPSQNRKSKANAGRASAFNTLSLKSTGSKVSLSSQSTNKPKPSILGRHRDKERGLGDAELVLPDNFDPAELGLTGSGHSRQASEDSKTSSKLTGLSRSHGTSAKKGEKRGMFGRMFGKKKDDEILSVGSVRSLESVDSFSSGSRPSETRESSLQAGIM